MDTQCLIRLLRLDLECKGYATTTTSEYVRLARRFLDEHQGSLDVFERETVANWITRATAKKTAEDWGVGHLVT